MCVEDVQPLDAANVTTASATQQAFAFRRLTQPEGARFAPLSRDFGGRATVYGIGLDEGSAYELILQPKAGGDAFRSMPGECEA